MTAPDDTPAREQESTDTESSGEPVDVPTALDEPADRADHGDAPGDQPTRIGHGVAVDLAKDVANRFAATDYDLANVDEWDSMDGNAYTTGVIGTGPGRASADLPGASFRLGNDALPEPRVRVDYTESGITLEVGGGAGDRRATFGVGLPPAAARELAAALYQAAEEYERRREAERGEE